MKLKKYSVNQNQFLVITYRDGRVEHRKGFVKHNHCYSTFFMSERCYFINLWVEKVICFCYNRFLKGYFKKMYI